MFFNPAIVFEPMLFLRLPVFQRCFNASKNRICKDLYMRRMFAMEICCDFGLCCFLATFGTTFCPKRMGFHHCTSSCSYPLPRKSCGIFLGDILQKPLSLRVTVI